MNLRDARRRTAEILDAHQGGDLPSLLADIFLVSLILINVAVIVLETVKPIQVRHGELFLRIEHFSLLVFSVEYLLRLWSCVDEVDPRKPDRRPSRLRWMLSPLGLVDLLAVLPSLVFLLLPQSMVSLFLLRVFRAMRLLRLLKLTRYSPALNVLFSVLRREGRVLAVVSFILVLILVFASWAMFLLERNAQPEAFSSIPAAMWWAVISLTTVGYGDVVPITDGGRFFAGLIGLIGIGMISLPAGILASGFSAEIHSRSKTYERAVQLAISDGSLSEHEIEQLEILKSELGIDDAKAHEILVAVEHRLDVHRSCPHCGKPLQSGETPSHETI